ncbi:MULTISPECIES: hypothetical protein [unclassified Nostoc]|uniref:hypothetical protein n=1 Tax=unclassified Nostoc TaxID=2593658 RepID=UPI000B9585E2|nr:hypothetical protein [Nostoc sp. 'Peltigera membranacea cyanobiont' 232]OYE05634.1 hypothetical protein CDG79_06735 [Nostoc sp. 'Peltigera membranacea cyanobiont' 232]
MAKQRISSKVVRARSLAIYELEQFISYVRTINPDDYENLEDYSLAWRDWESLVREQDTQVSVLVSEDSEKIAGDVSDGLCLRQTFVREP